MPLKPLQFASATKTQSDKLGPGSVVEYEQHGKPILGLVLSEKKNKWHLLNERGQELELEPARLFLLPGRLPEVAGGNTAKAGQLEQLANSAQSLAATSDLAEAWALFAEGSREIGVKDLCEILFPDQSLVHYLAARRALVNDRIYFKRLKTTFQSRPKETVTQLKEQALVEAKRAAERKQLKDALIERIQGGQQTLPNSVIAFEEFAALGGRAQFSKETAELVDEIIDALHLDIRGKHEEKTFQLLVRARHFTQDENLDLIRLNLTSRFATSVTEEARRLEQSPKPDSSREDFTSLNIVTIDGVETLDIDDGVSLEETADGYRLGIHISDVASTIQPGSTLEREAIRRASSIYCIDSYISMFPPAVCEDLCSLVAGKDRQSLSFVIELNRDLSIRSRRVTRSLVKVSTRLNYDEVDEFLYGDSKVPTKLSTELQSLMLLLWKITSFFESQRIANGATMFSRREMAAKIQANGEIHLESSSDDTPARRMVGELMIFANETAAMFAKDREFPLIFRSQEEPDVELSAIGGEIENEVAREYFRRGFMKRSVTGVVPKPHFGLGLPAYTQITSPIRRVVDLFNQRQLETVLVTGKPFYDAADLVRLIENTETTLDEVTYVQRERNRYWLLKYLEQQQVTELAAIVVKAEGAKPLAEIEHVFLLSPFKTKQPNNGNTKLRPGQQVKLKVEQLNARKGVLVLQEL